MYIRKNWNLSIIFICWWIIGTYHMQQKQSFLNDYVWHLSRAISALIVNRLRSGRRISNFHKRIGTIGVKTRSFECDRDQFISPLSSKWQQREFSDFILATKLYNCTTWNARENGNLTVKIGKRRITFFQACILLKRLSRPRKISR